MAICTICEEEIKPKRCVHGKKTANCGCCSSSTAYVKEHKEICPGKKLDTKNDPVALSAERAKLAAKERWNIREIGDAIGREYRINEAAATSTNEPLTPEISSALSFNAMAASTNVTLSAPAEALLSNIRRLRHMPIFTSCRHCNKAAEPGRRIRKCTGCGVTGYCGMECQKAHWDAQHKSECRALREIGELDDGDDGEGQEVLMERLEKLMG